MDKGSRNVVLCLFIVGAVLLIPSVSTADQVLSIGPGWNLLSTRVGIQDIPSLLGEKFNSAWKWEILQDNNNTWTGKWAVYLPGNVTTWEQYASSKGFLKLISLNPGDGFWVNAGSATTLTLTGQESNDGKISLKPGWNLKGLRSTSGVNVQDKFNDPSKFISIWKWHKTTQQDGQDKWAVFLSNGNTQTYAQGKGFLVLDTISPGEGFWVNVASNNPFDMTIDVEMPPILFKVMDASSKGDKTTYKPVGGAEIFLDGKTMGKTDSQGGLQVDSGAKPNSDLMVVAPGYTIYNGKLSTSETNTAFIFLQKSDPAKETLEATQSQGLQLLDYGPNYQKPTPKQIISSDKKAGLIVTNMKLQKDITVAVTPLKTAAAIQQKDDITKTDLGPNITPICGAMVDMVDSQGKPITNEDAGFSAQVKPFCNNLISTFTMEDLKNMLDNNQLELYLLSRGEAGWYNVGEAKVETVQNDTRLSPNITYCTKLEDFLFVAKQKSPSGIITITGKVIDQSSKTGIQFAYVGIDVIWAEALTDDQGNFTLNLQKSEVDALTDKNVYLFALADNYFWTSKILDLSGSTNISNIIIELKPIFNALTIKGKVLDKSTESPISDALLKLKINSPLSEIFLKEDGLYVGKNPTSLYEWVIKDGSDNIVYTSTVTGKNYLLLDELKNSVKLSSDQDYNTYNISLTVTSKAEGYSPYVETGSGIIFIYKSPDDGKTYIVMDLYLDLMVSPYYEIFTDESGNYEFYGIPKEALGFTKISASKKGYFDSPYEAIAQPQGNVVEKNISLEPKAQAQDIIESFENDLGNWTTKVIVDNESKTNTSIKWQIVDTPENIGIKSPILAGSQPTIYTDAVAIVGDIILDPESSADDYKTYKSQVTFSENGKPVTLPILLYDWDDTPGSEGFEYVSFDESVDTMKYFLWYDYTNWPSSENGYSFTLQKGSSLMVTYLMASPEESLFYHLPAYQGEKVAWAGYMGDGKFKGSYYDPALGSGKNVELVLESPVFDLKNFSSPTLSYATWYEINPKTFGSVLVEIAIVDEGLQDAQEITLETDYGPVLLKKGQFVPLAQFNPYFLWGDLDLAQLEKLNKDVDNDSMDDDWEAENYYCSDSSDLDPDQDSDNDGFTNLEEFQAGLHPCLIDTFYFYPISTMEYDTQNLVWQNLEHNLKGFEGHQIKIRFRLLFTNTPGNFLRGWAIDNILIKDEESWYPLYLLTSEFGFTGNVGTSFISPGQAESWEGNYTIQFQNVYKHVEGANPEQYPISDTSGILSQVGNYFYLFLVIDDMPITIEGFFKDPGFTIADIIIYDSDTNGDYLYGYGTLGEKDGVKKCEFVIYDNYTGFKYTGEFILVKQ